MDFKEIVGVSFNFLYFFGIMHPKFDSVGVALRYSFRVFFFLGFFFGGIMLAELFNLFFSLGNLRDTIKALFLTLTNLVSIFKFYVISKNQKKLIILASKINRKEFQPQTPNQVESLKRYIRLSKMISYTLYVGCTATCTFWAVYPFTEENGPFLPIAAYIPFDTKNPLIFGLVYVYEIIATLIGGYTDLSADALIASLIMVVSAQFNILNNTLANIDKISQTELKLKKYRSFDKKRQLARLQEIMDRKLIQCVLHHKIIIEFAEDWASLFSISTFGQFVVSVFVFCATFFEMTQVPFVSIRFLSMALYQSCMLMEIFPVCYFGNEVILESNNLTNSAYHGNWINCSIGFKKKMVFFMTRSQRVLKLYAAGYFTLSLETFIKILKSSWSYFAVLLQVNKE